MKNHQCLHLDECQQHILKHDFVWKCLGKISWNQENCFKSNAIGTKDMFRLPTEWWAMKLIEAGNKEKVVETEKKE